MDLETKKIRNCSSLNKKPKKNVHYVSFLFLSFFSKYFFFEHSFSSFFTVLEEAIQKWETEKAKKLKETEEYGIHFISEEDAIEMDNQLTEGQTSTSRKPSEDIEHNVDAMPEVPQPSKEKMEEILLERRKKVFLAACSSFPFSFLNIISLLSFLHRTQKKCSRKIFMDTFFLKALMDRYVSAELQEEIKASAQNIYISEKKLSDDK